MSAYSDEMKKATRELSVSGSVICPSGDIIGLSGSDIISFRLSEGDAGGLRPGSVISGALTLTLDDSSGQWEPGGSRLGANTLIGSEFRVSVGAVTDGGALFSPLGAFICSDAYKEENSPAMTVECHDAIRAADDIRFTDALLYPKTLREVFFHALSQAGLAYPGTVPNGDLIIDAPPAWGIISVRKALKHCAALMGAFISADRNGDLSVRPLTGGGPYVISAAERLYRRDALKAAEGVNRVRAYTVNAREDTISAPEVIEAVSPSLIEGSTLVIENNPLIITGASHARANVSALLNSVAGMGGGSSRFEWRGDASLTIGDKVLLTGGTALEGVLSRQTFIFDGGLHCRCACGAAG